MLLAYRRLITTDYSDPSDVMNDIDEVRAQLDEVDPDDRSHLEAKCLSAELEVHCLFTPIQLYTLL